MINKKTKEGFTKLLEGYVILYATIESKERIAFVTKDIGGKNGHLKHAAQLKIRVLLYNPKCNLDRFGLAAIGWSQGVPKAYVSYVGTEKEPVVVWSSDAYSKEFASECKRRESTDWQHIPAPKNLGEEMLRAVHGVKRIDGETFMFGRFRKLYRRTGVQKWEDLSYEETHPNLHKDLAKRIKQKKSMVSGVNAGFDDIDGFSKDDIYGCGDGGDLWHYNGSKWRRLDPPSNFDMSAILCAPDGYVYIAGNTGEIMKGRYTKEKGEEWKILKSPLTRRVHSLAWFQDKVYIGVEEGLYSIDSKENIEQYKFSEDGWHQYSFKNVASCEEALLSYGVHQALLFDGKEWEELVGSIVVPEL